MDWGEDYVLMAVEGMGGRVSRWVTQGTVSDEVEGEDEECKFMHYTCIRHSGLGRYAGV